MSLGAKINAVTRVAEWYPFSIGSYFYLILITGSFYEVFFLPIVAVATFHSGFWFVSNDIFDREDDKKKVVNRNPYSNGTYDVKIGYAIALALLAGIYLTIFFYIDKPLVLWVSLGTLAFQLIYNLGAKKLAFFDALTHGFAATGPTVIIGAALGFSDIWLIILCYDFSSNFNICIYQHGRDYEADKAANHKNLLITFGFTACRLLCGSLFLIGGIIAVCIQTSVLGLVFGVVLFLLFIPFLFTGDSFWKYYLNGFTFPYLFYLPFLRKEDF